MPLEIFHGPKLDYIFFQNMSKNQNSMTLHYFQFSDNSQHFPQQFHNSTPNWTQGPSQRGWRGSPGNFRGFTPRGGSGGGFTPRGGSGGYQNNQSGFTPRGSGGGRGFTPRGNLLFGLGLGHLTLHGKVLSLLEACFDLILSPFLP